MDKRFMKASGWAMLSEISAKLVSPVSFLILTHLLSPKDFGVVAVATTILTYLYVVSDLGVSKVIIQKGELSDNIDELSSTGFWINILISTILFLFMFLGAGALAKIMGSIESTNVIRVLSFQVLFYALSSIQTARRKMRMDFRFLFRVRMITTLTPAVISIGFAFMGFGYWAIVWGQLGSAAFACLYLWITSDWRPNLVFSKRLINNILSKSIWSTIDQLIILIPVGLDTYLISNTLGTQDLGFYSTSRSLFTSVSAISLSAIAPVLFSHLSLIRKDLLRFKEQVLFGQKMILTIALTLGIFVFLFSGELEHLIFNKNWTSLGGYFGIMFFIMSFEYFGSAITEAIRAKGLFKLLAFNSIIATALTVPILFLSVTYGLRTYIISRSLSLFLFFPLLFYFSRKYISISFWESLCRNKAIIINYFLIFIIHTFIYSYFNIFSTHFLTLIKTLLYCIFLFTVWMSAKQEILKLINQIRKRI